MRRLATLTSVLVLAFGACGDGDEEARSTTTSTADAPVEAAAVVPGDDGIAVGDAAYAFGTDAGPVIDAITEVLGPPQDESDVPECPAGPASTVGWEDVQLVVQEGAFVGWSLGELSQLATDGGVEVGSTLADVQARYGDGVSIDPQSTLGVELFVEEVGLSGLVTEDAPTGTVVALWTGRVCTFR